jgi:GDPmannose 4,6-dehydratase
MPRVIIRGIHGQAGQIAAQLLTGRAELFGVTHSALQSGRPDGYAQVFFWDGSDRSEIQSIVGELKADFILNFAAVHSSSEKTGARSIDQLDLMAVNFRSLQLMAEAVLRASPRTMLIHAASSHIFTPATLGDRVFEASPANPSNLYGLSKLFGMQLLEHYRRESKLESACAIFFNHESELRTESFVSRKISLGAAGIKRGSRDRLALNNIGACADFSCARDAMLAVIAIGEARSCENYVVASGRGTSIRQLVEWAFEEVDLDWKEFVGFEDDQPRPYNVGICDKLTERLGWHPTRDIEAVIRSMVQHDLARPSV